MAIDFKIKMNNLGLIVGFDLMEELTQTDNNYDFLEHDLKEKNGQSFSEMLLSFNGNLSHEELDYLEHYGVPGMKWGRSRARVEGVSRSTNRTAYKDAKEAARAKMFYGKGAGTRRKLINATVAARSKKDPNYAKAFDQHFKDQDLSTHASKAIRERKVKDSKEKNKQRASALARRLTGEMGTQAAIVALAAGGYAFYKSPKGQQVLNKTISSVSKAVDKQKINAGARHLNKLFKQMG